jgi:hypothetical protein
MLCIHYRRRAQPPSQTTSLLPLTGQPSPRTRQQTGARRSGPSSRHSIMIAAAGDSSLPASKFSHSALPLRLQEKEALWTSGAVQGQAGSRQKWTAPRRELLRDLCSRGKVRYLSCLLCHLCTTRALCPPAGCEECLHIRTTGGSGVYAFSLRNACSTRNGLPPFALTVWFKTGTAQLEWPPP